MNTPNGPVLIDLEEDKADEAPSPATAPPVPDAGATTVSPAAMERLAVIAGRRPNRLARWFWGLLLSVLVFFGTLMVWSAVSSLLAQNAILGGAATVLLAVFGVVCLAIILRELTAFARLSRLDKMQTAADQALIDGDLRAARGIAEALSRFYDGRPELAAGRQILNERLEDSFDADATLGLVEAQLVTPLDAAAVREVEVATRQVAMITALVPLALADVVAALTANLRMIRRIAEIYGGRAGTIGTWRLMRAVLTHLVATGAVAVGDDMIGSFAGGSVLSKISRRFGEGVVNGALTARVGVAAMEVCRPLPWVRARRPSVTALVRRALSGLFASDEKPAER